MNLIMKKNVFRRGMAFALSTAVAVSIVPPLGTGSTAKAASDASPVRYEVNLGMSSLYTDSTSWSKSTGAKVYYGNLTDATGKSPVAYRVLGKSTETQSVGAAQDYVLLDSDSILYRSYFDESSGGWNGSYLERLLNSKYVDSRNAEQGAMFSKVEANLLMPTTLKENTYTIRTYLEGESGTESVKDEAAEDYIFILSAKEIRNLYADKQSTNKNVSGDYWWLRSSKDNSMKVVWLDSLGNFQLDAECMDDNIGVCPAFNMNTSGVLFSTAVGFDKKKAITASSAQIKESAVNDWTLTLKDTNKTIQLTSGKEAVLAADGTVTIPYTYSDSRNSQNPVNQVSVLITDKAYTDKDAKVLYYGALSGNTTQSIGTGTFTLPQTLTGTWGTDYQVYLLAECVTDGNYSDYASLPYCLTSVSKETGVRETVKQPVAKVSDDKTSLIISSGTEGADIYYTLDGSIPDQKNGTKYTGPISFPTGTSTITAIAAKDGMDNSMVIQLIVIKGADGTIVIKTDGTSDPTPTPNPTPSTDQKKTEEQYKPGTVEYEKWLTSDKVDSLTKGQLTGRASATTKAVTLRWENLKDADGYIIYGNYCNTKAKKYKYKKIKTISAKKFKNKSTASCKLTKVVGKQKLKKNTFYKFKVVAYKNVKDSKSGKTVKKAIGKSYQLHTIIETKSGKYGNPKGVIVTTTKNKKISAVTLKKKKSVLLDARASMPKRKKLKKHCEEIRWISTNKKIATVTQAGRIKAKKKGKCYVYALAQNGARKKIKVTVK